MTKRKAMSAADLIRRLNADPDFVAKRDLAESEREAESAEWRRAEAPLLAALEDLGVSVGSVWDLVNTSDSYSDVLTVLLAHLQRPYPSRVREGIARALAVPESKFAWDVLTRLYREEPAGDAKHGLAAAIAAAADIDVAHELLGLVRDARNGPSRLLLLGRLEKIAGPRVRDLLVELGDDPELGKEVRVILERLARKAP